MASRIFTRCLGVVYLLLGLCAFVPPLNAGPRPSMEADSHVGVHFTNLFHNIPMNFILAPILIGFGISGLLTSFDTKAARYWCRIVFVVSLLAMLLGLCPIPVATVLGFIPLYGWMCGVSLISALLVPYFAFFDGPMPAAATEPVFRQ